MPNFFLRLMCLLCAHSGILYAQATKAAVTVASPDGAIEIEFSLTQQGTEEGVAGYRVLYRGKPVMEFATLGLEFAETGLLSGGLSIVKVVEDSGDTSWPVIAGKSSSAHDHWRGAVVSLQEQAEPGRRFDLVLRAYDDGVAFRYALPEQPALDSFTLTAERSHFRPAGQWTAYVLPLDGFAAHYEAKYRVQPVGAIEPEDHVGLPLLLDNGDGVYLAITEAALMNYAGMYLSGVSGAPGMLVSTLAPMPDQPEVKVKGSAPHVSPWRVIMVSDSPGRLIESNLLLNLNEPCAIKDPSWIQPGKTMFPWWNGYVLEGVDFEPGLNTATIKHYIDFCAEQGIEYHSLDGFGNAWYGGKIRPYQGADITTAIETIDLPEVLAYARAKGVRLRLWMHWEALIEQMDRAFALYEQWGIEGVMVDFMDRDDQEMVNFLERVVRTAAKHKLTVTLHGSYKPTGTERTWPNLLTSEGVRNLEYNKFRGRDPILPEHELTVPFTRMLAGAMDFHQGGFRHVRLEEFQTQSRAPRVIGTRCRQLASYVVYFNPLPMVVDSPDAYRGEAGFEFLAQVPTTWDQTHFVSGEVGQHVVLARRRGQQWYLGGMTDRQPREVTVGLDFLDDGDFVAEIWRDELDAHQPPAALQHETRLVTARDRLKMRMAPSGGYVARFTPVQ
jgi:alpha-glucosidase